MRVFWIAVFRRVRVLRVQFRTVFSEENYLKEDSILRCARGNFPLGLMFRPSQV